MLKFWKKKPALGVGLGVGLLGAVVLAFRYGVRRVARQPIPDTISPAIFATRVAQTTHGEMIYHISGAGEPLVFLHGIYPGASSYEWSKVYPQFAISHEVIAPDLIGFGESERPRRGLDADEHVQSLSDFIVGVCGNARPALVASGFGAALAILLAAQHPDRVSRLILFAPAGLDEAARRAPLGFALLSRLSGLNRFVYRNYFSRKPFIRGWLTQFGFSDPGRVNDEVVEVLTTCASQYGAEHAILAFLRGRLSFDAPSQLRRVTQPVTIIWPAANDRFSAEFPQQVRQSLPACHVVYLENTGALGPLESPERLAALLDPILGGSFPLHGAA